MPKLAAYKIYLLSVFLALCSPARTLAKPEAPLSCVQKVVGIAEGGEQLAKSYLASRRINEAAWAYAHIGNTKKAAELTNSIVHSLKTAHVLFDVPLGEGITGAKYVEFENGMAAVFKAQIDTGAEAWASHSQHEIAVYTVDKILGLNMVPVTIERTLNGKQGSLQYFVKDAKMGGQPSNELRLLDYLVANTDRHPGNFLTREDGSLVAIDHGSCFGIMGHHGAGYTWSQRIPSERVYRALKNTPRSTWEKELRPHLRAAFEAAQNASPQKRNAPEVQFLLKTKDPDAAFEDFLVRVKKIVDFIDHEIAENGRAAVFPR